MFLRTRFSGTISVHILAAVRLLREELQLLQEPGSYVGEVIKVRQISRRRADMLHRGASYVASCCTFKMHHEHFLTGKDFMPWYCR